MSAKVVDRLLVAKLAAVTCPIPVGKLLFGRNGIRGGRRLATEGEGDRSGDDSLLRAGLELCRLACRFARPKYADDWLQRDTAVSGLRSCPWVSEMEPQEQGGGRYRATARRQRLTCSAIARCRASWELVCRHPAESLHCTARKISPIPIMI